MQGGTSKTKSILGDWLIVSSLLVPSVSFPFLFIVAIFTVPVLKGDFTENWNVISLPLMQSKLMKDCYSRVPYRTHPKCHHPSYLYPRFV